jgi:hypothetical protein
MPLVPYRTRCATRILSNPCPICGKRPLMKHTKQVEKNGQKVLVCKHHQVEEKVIP